MTDTDKKYDELQAIGKTTMSCLKDMVAALECDYDRLQELKDERDTWVKNDGGDGDEQNRTTEEWLEEFPDESEELSTLEAMAGECESREDAEQRIQEDPLSVEVRSGWCANKEGMEAEEFCILLSTGGPATRIIGELDDNNEPHRATLQVQDWGTPWTDYYESDTSDILLTYARCFYFGE